MNTVVLNTLSTELPLVSVVIYVHNAESHLSECLNTVLQQTYSNLQIIIIDDYSNDSSLKIAKQFQKQDARLTIIENDVVKGIGVSKNNALNSVLGEYFTFIESGDFIHKDYVNILANILLDKNTDIVMCKIITKNNTNIHNDFSLFNITIDRYTVLHNVSSLSNLASMYKTEVIKIGKISFEENIVYKTMLVFFIKALVNIQSITVYIINDDLYFQGNNKKNIITNVTEILQSITKILKSYILKQNEREGALDIYSVYRMKFLLLYSNMLTHSLKYALNNYNFFTSVRHFKHVKNYIVSDDIVICNIKFLTHYNNTYNNTLLRKLYKKNYIYICIMSFINKDGVIKKSVSQLAYVIKNIILNIINVIIAYLLFVYFLITIVYKTIVAIYSLFKQMVGVFSLIRKLK